MITAAAILAGGSGKRFGGDIPKQFVSVNGRMIIEYTIDAFEKNECIDEICVVVGSDYIDLMKNIAGGNFWSKLKGIIEGGRERYDSSVNAVRFFDRKYDCDDINILIHDAARPNVSQKNISCAAKLLKEYEAVCTAYAATDTIAVSDKTGEIIECIPDRKYMYHVQTPQGFHLETIKKAYEKALADPDFTATDDCGVVKKYLPDVKIKITLGSFENIKITRPEDLKLI